MSEVVPLSDRGGDMRALANQAFQRPAVAPLTEGKSVRLLKDAKHVA